MTGAAVRGRKLPRDVHGSRPWRVHELTTSFRLEDVWALPTPGGPDDLPRLVQLLVDYDPAQGASRAVATLFAIRERLGELLGWDRAEAGLGARVPSLRERLPADLRDAPRGPDLGDGTFRSLYLLEDEWALEVANRTVHGVLHVGWVPDLHRPGGHRGELAILVEPNGLLGEAYLATIRPFRRLIVYPWMTEELGRRWHARHRSDTRERLTLRNEGADRGP